MENEENAKVELVWKSLATIAAAFIGLCSTITATGVFALIGWMFVFNADLAVLQNSVDKTEKSVSQIDRKVDSLDQRLTRLEQDDKASQDKIKSFWDREWPELSKSIRENRDAIRDLEIEMRSLNDSRKRAREIEQERQRDVRQDRAQDDKWDQDRRNR